jgi:hypothetical protein
MTLKSSSPENATYPASSRTPPDFRIPLSNFEISFRSDVQKFSHTLHERQKHRIPFRGKRLLRDARDHARPIVTGHRRTRLPPGRRRTLAKADRRTPLPCSIMLISPNNQEVKYFSVTHGRKDGKLCMYLKDKSRVGEDWLRF